MDGVAARTAIDRVGNNAGYDDSKSDTPGIRLGRHFL